MLRNLLLILIVIVAAAVVVVEDAAAETRLKERISSYRSALDTMGPFEPLADVQIEASRQRLLRSADDFETFLNRAPAEDVAGWKRYLYWSQMHEALEQPSPDVELLSTVLRQYHRDELGLEQKSFRRFRSRLDEYVTLLQFAAAEELAVEPQVLFDDLALRLARYDAEPRRSDALAIGLRLKYLEMTGNASPDLLARLREPIDHSNGFLRVSNRMVQQMLRRDVRDQRAFSRNDGQVVTRGTASTVGRVFMQTVPWAEGAAFDVRLIGSINSPNMVSRQRNIVVRSSCATQVSAWKRVKFTDEGFTIEPARAHCNSNIQINSVSARTRMVERLAERRAESSLPEYEQQSAGMARQEITSQIDSEVEGALKEAGHVYHDFFRTPLIRYGALPEEMDFSSTKDRIEANVRMAGDGRLAAPFARPQIDPSFDIGLLLHESLIDNYCSAMLGGKTILDKQWVNIMNVMTGVEPRALWVHDRTDRWSFSFHPSRPLEVDFRDGLVTISLRSRQVTRAKRTLPRTILVSGTFRVELNRDGAVLVRQGDLVTRFDDEGAGSAHPTSGQDDEWIQFIARKFNAILQPEMHFDGLVPPAGGSLGKLRQIQIREFDTADGWMTMGFEFNADAAGSPSQPVAKK